MSYCRFGDDSDVYVYAHVSGGFECCACSLAELVTTIFTSGLKDDDPRKKLFGDIKPCENCQGVGCKQCMMPGNINLKTRSEMIAHLQEHINAGHKVPPYAIEQLTKEIEEEGEENPPYFDDDYEGPAVIDVGTGEIKKVTEL